ITQAIPLARHYDVVIANPPYMGSKNQNATLKKFLNDGYKDVKSDLFSAFTVRIMEMTRKGGFIGMMTPFNWMFLSSYEKMRQIILDNYTLTNLVRPEFHAFFDSAFVTVCGFTLFADSLPEYKGAFIDLDDFYGADVQPVKALEAIQNPDCGYFHRAAATDFKKIPGSPIAYWISNQIREMFQRNKTIGDQFIVKAGISTGKNEEFILFWPEVEYEKLRLRGNKQYWYTPHNKGGEFRKWSGNREFILKYHPNAIKKMERNPGYRPDGQELYFKPMIGWSKITSSKTSFRFFPEGFTFDSAGLAVFSKKLLPKSLAGFLNSKVVEGLIAMLNPTLNVTPQVIKKLPWLEIGLKGSNLFDRCIAIASSDWDFYETSWDFTTLPLLQARQLGVSLANTYTELRQQWQAATLEMQRLEEENNRIFIDAYGLQDELTPDVPLSEITLTCNPHYRYSGNKSEAELEALLLADTMREFISYAVGCMFGRYSLDKPGLILANQGETADDYRQIVNSELSFPPDEDNAIPMLDGNWFPDDITERFKKFLRVTFGEAHYEENLAFIEAAIGRDIRSYFLRDFYDHHVKMYKKRPIYWLFSSA
ncbi:MAG: BREX-1 system adenine-specific DNA-methyltransferase PglX, partial [Candidatus Promineifilaceae bacterium]